MAGVTSGSVKTSSYDGRHYVLEWTATQSIENNQSTIKWTLKAVGGNSGWYAERTLKVVLGGATVYSKTDKVNRYTGTVASGTKVITHNASGDASFSISISAAVYYSAVNCTGSDSFTLKNIPRKSTLAASNGTLGTAQELTVTRKATAFTHTITYKCGTASGTICTKSTDLTPSFTPPLSLASQNTTGETVSITFTIETFNGNTSIGTNTKTITCSIPASVKPSVELTVTDEMGYADKYGGFIQTLSKFKIVSKPTIAYGSAIESYTVKADGNTYTKADVTTGVIKNKGSLKIESTVKDKRKRSGTDSETVTVLAYEPPIISGLETQRCDADGTPNRKGEYIKVLFSGAVTPLNDINSAVYTLEYKKASEDEYTAETLTDYNDVYSVENAQFVFAADTKSSYNIRLTIADDFNPSKKTTTGKTANVFWSILKNASGEILGFALNKFAEIEGVFDIGFKTRFMGGILQPILEANTDFDTVTIPNTYTLKNAANAGYLHCPVSEGTGTLTIEECGEEGQLHQIVKVCSKTNPITYERFYYGEAWGEWVCTSDFGGKLLWSGNYYMTETHIASLSEAISKQTHGIVLVFARYNTENNPDAYAWHSFFVPKYAVSGYNTSGHTFMLAANKFVDVGMKYLYIRDTQINGNENNDATGTANGITYNNKAFTLRYVIGV